MNETILIVDDDTEIRKLITIYLENEGFETIQLANGEEAVQFLQSIDVDLILLDVMMPKMNGIEACMKIREEKNTPIIFLSAKSEDLDKIQGLISGADDYITKPFNPLELITRVKSQIRRSTKYNEAIEQNRRNIQIEDLNINLETRLVYVHGNEIRLTPKEFDILALLAKNQGMVMSVEKIYEMVWRDDFLKSDNTVMVHITKIREKIEDNPKKPSYIKTVWGVGYKI
ncbi:MAG: response regulator transcription factor [Kurthia gibsonii]